MDTDSLVIHIKTPDFYEDIAYNVEKWFHTSNYEVDKPYPRGMNKNVIGLMKDELGRKIMKEFFALRAKIYSYLMNDYSEHKKSKGTKKCGINRRAMFENYTDCSFNDKTILKSQQRFKSNCHNVIITTYPFGTSTNNVCENVMLTKI